ncbi:MAG: hypothetical protein K2X57_21695 [Xanthobacteraceae bacterium]|nr:hypothetical protein [Xanthobacteraceae bacterium]
MSAVPRQPFRARGCCASFLARQFVDAEFKQRGELATLCIVKAFEHLTFDGEHTLPCGTELSFASL